ncbi:HAD hydrolase-like protein [Candidatus Woesearchaeota archaeon]|jgi:FMN phosphatase YigB (HAD superfamily)|nr:HAD hydrolase-like protein [Candidatus Woesearchaeota archaeon]MBT4110806.1 HAD hydrolase-like protein [Candidatus Woesearchaeota archaeon]MBT4336682.1 HAD hydrolase-like protein [Candidatus Woesearchaeota archaeon]MBT4469569.1 HAD hydrolase-like protein [Candidatus Woesearchaeota archaeon]MBT6743931.1 HAD hydrolase-like protein [Candidatus Woesearchaeota archaeon]
MRFEEIDITHLFLDVDGTLFNKKKEYILGSGSIEDVHEFFRYVTFTEALKQGNEINENELIEKVVEEYHCRIHENNLLEYTARFSNNLKRHYHDLVRKHGSNGKVFTHEFETSPGFFAKIVGKTDFSSILTKDHKLIDTIDTIKQKGIQLGLLTTERYDTVTTIANVLGLSLDDFVVNTGAEYPILCSENVKEKKPSLEGFQKIITITNATPNKIAYVGDSLTKDVHPPLSLGMNAIHVTWKDHPLRIRGDYVEMPTIYHLSEVFK